MEKPFDHDNAITVRRRPLLGVTLAAIGGMVLGSIGTPPPLPVLAAAILALLLAWLCEGRRLKAAAALLWLAVILTGTAAMALRLAAPAGRLADRLAGTDSVQFKIRVTGDPVRYTTVSGRPAWASPATIMAWRLDEIGAWQWTDGGKISAHWRAVAFSPPPRYGDQWRIQGHFYSPPPDRARAQPPRFWARRTWRVATGTGWQWVAQCYAWRRGAADRLAAGIDAYPERVAIIHALLLGLRQELTPAIRDAFAASGTLHVIAISGLHVGVMTALFVFVLQCAGLSRTHWFYILAPLLIGYTLATGARPSAVRACIMALAYWSALPLERRPDAPSALALAALILLTADPLQLTSPGFIFSFVVVAGLLVFFEPVYHGLTAPVRARLAYRPPATPGLFAREAALLLQAAAGLAVVSLIAWIMALPLSARFFGRVSLVTLPANLLVVPLSFLVVVTGCLSLIAGAVFPALGVIVNHANLVWVGALLRVLAGFAALPGAALAFTLPGWALPAWYAALAWVGWRLHQRRPRPGRASELTFRQHG